MRSAAESIHDPIPDSATVEDLCGELQENLRVPEALVNIWLGTLLGDNLMQVKDVKSLQLSEMMKKLEAASFTDAHFKSLCICLGSLSEPFSFSRGGEVLEDIKGVKGGVMQEVAPQLSQRRPYMAEYFPPPIFDAHKPGSPTRSELALRKLIVQEVCPPYLPSFLAHMAHVARMWHALAQEVGVHRSRRFAETSTPTVQRGASS